VRCVVAVLSPMTDPITLRLVLSIANELDFELDHQDIKTAYLNAELPEKERFYCSPRATRPNGEWGYSTRRQCWATSAQRRCHPEEALYLPTFSHLFDCQ
jgi:hypothetical protein